MKRLVEQAGALVAGLTLGGLIAGTAEALYRGVEAWYAAALYGALWGAVGLGTAVLIAPWGQLWRRHRPTAGAGLALALGLSGLVLVRFFVERDVLAEAPSARWIALGAGLFAGFVLAAVGLALSPWLATFDRRPRRGYALAVGVIAAFTILALRGDDSLPLRPSAPTRQLHGEGVILVVVDTLRADMLGAYGASAHRDAPATPKFDAFAAKSLLFRNVSAQASWTRPAMATLLTSRHASGHATMAKNAVLPDSLPTIASELAAAKVHTGAVVTNYNLEQDYGFARGFDEFRYLPPARYLGAPARANRLAAYNVYRLLRERFWRKNREARHFYRSAHTVNAVCFDMLERMGDGRFFLWLHYMEPHDPYFATDGRSFARVSDPQPSAREAGTLRDAYRDDVRRVDEGFGELLEGLTARGLAARTTVIFVADHGEEFAEHGGFYHGQTLYEEQLAVPLAIRGPAIAPSIVTSLAEQLDIAPTILARFGVAAPSTWEGHDLLSPHAAPEVTVAEEDHEGHRLQSIRRGAQKLIVANPDNPRGLRPREVYDLAADPHERTPLAAEPPTASALGDELHAILDRARSGAATASSRKLDANAEAELRAIGYVR